MYRIKKNLLTIQKNKANNLPFSRIGMISGNTLSPSFLTKSPSVRAATCLLSYEFEAKKEQK